MPKSRRFEYTDATSRKFWEVSVAAATVTVHYGRIGTDGQTQVKSYDSPAVATATAEKQIAEKVKKGYREIGTGETAQQSATAKTPAKPAAAEKAPAKKAPAKKAPAKKAPAKKAPAKKVPAKKVPAKKVPAPTAAAAQSDAPAGVTEGIAGKAFLFTGTLTTLTRAEAEQQVKAQGGTVLASVSDELDYLVVGEKAGSKLAKATKIPSITILSEADFQLMAARSATEEPQEEIEDRDGMQTVVLSGSFRSAVPSSLLTMIEQENDFVHLRGNALYVGYDLDVTSMFGSPFGKTESDFTDFVRQFEASFRKLAPFMKTEFEIYYFTYTGEYTATMWAFRKGALSTAGGWIGDFCRSRSEEAKNDFVDRNHLPLKSGEIEFELSAAMEKALRKVTK